ncbi:MAG TPA: hypothetical protein VMU80_04985 [Bryobacteraceae bacterium]|nr:hypothetical protein [Bryobacteraceae bacterium]
MVLRDAHTVLKAHDWPGNIRELQNYIERAVAFSPEPVSRLPLTDFETDDEGAFGGGVTHSCRRRARAHTGHIEAN